MRETGLGGPPPGMLVTGEPISTAIGLAITGITLAVTAFLNRKRPQQKIKATQITNEYESLMQQNLAAWEASGHTTSEKAQALANFDGLWHDFVRTVSDPALGDPGSRAVPERSRGGQWDWASYYRDPIATSEAVDDSGMVISTLQSTLQSGDPMMLMGLAALGVGLFVALRD